MGSWLLVKYKDHHLQSNEDLNLAIIPRIKKNDIKVKTVDAPSFVV